jgi:hypothetical protein
MLHGLQLIFKTRPSPFRGEQLKAEVVTRLMSFAQDADQVGTLCYCV